MSDFRLGDLIQAIDENKEAMNVQLTGSNVEIYHTEESIQIQIDESITLLNLDGIESKELTISFLFLSERVKDAEIYVDALGYYDGSPKTTVPPEKIEIKKMAFRDDWWSAIYTLPVVSRHMRIELTNKGLDRTGSFNVAVVGRN